MAIMLKIPCINQMILPLLTYNPPFKVTFMSQYSTLFDIKMQLDNHRMTLYNEHQIGKRCSS